MGKKKKIREDFDIVFQNGDEKAIKEYLEKYPWLLDEVSSSMDDTMSEQHQIIAAIGVMEDELNDSVPFNEINHCLKEDFSISKRDEEIQKILYDIENLHLVEKQPNGWVLTNEGEKICDVYLNKNLNDLEL